MSASCDPPPLPPPPPAPATVARRPRRGAREVSSRYLSTPKPSPRSTPNPSPRRTTPSCRSRSEYGSDTESESADENRIPATLLPGSRSSKDKETFYFTSQRIPSNRKVVHKLFDERSDPGSRLPEDSRRIPEDSRRRPRPGTPISPSLARNPVRQKQNLTPNRSESDSSVQNGALCESPPINLKTRNGNSTDLRSSMPSVDSSTRNPNPNPLVCRSLNSSLSGSDFLKGETKRRVSTEKPPQPPGVKTGADLKKGVKKGKRSEEEIHSLKLLSNRFLQLRFLNAKAEVATNARKKYMERDLYGASIGISNCRERIQEKKIQLECLRRDIMLSSILEFQNPYLEDWDKIEEDQSEYLAGIITALQNASIRVPVDSDIKVNAKEINAALEDATKFLEPLSTSLQNFVPKAEEVEIASDLAEVTSRERELVQECGNLLAFASDLQLKESSLRSMLIQRTRQNKQA
ncbi:hypothetical protein LUZ60_008712 [Juncus effusus]|nr:hypothetical protein LUZ60_008712 [Juncus effusus]